VRRVVGRLVGGLVVNGRWEGQWLSYVRVRYGMDVGMLRRVVHNGNGNGNGGSSTVICEQQKARVGQKGWAGTKGLLQVPGYDDEVVCEGESGLDGWKGLMGTVQ
jgi:hypothetical protein